MNSGDSSASQVVFIDWHEFAEKGATKVRREESLGVPFFLLYYQSEFSRRELLTTFYYHVGR